MKLKINLQTSTSLKDIYIFISSKQGTGKCNYSSNLEVCSNPPENESLEDGDGPANIASKRLTSFIQVMPNDLHIFSHLVKFSD
jgi:hypothetical protein